MRKIDYEILAKLIRNNIAFAQSKPQPLHEYHKGQIQALENLARHCADDMHVDKIQFLKACGIKP